MLAGILPITAPAKEQPFPPVKDITNFAAVIFLAVKDIW